MSDLQVFWEQARLVRENAHAPYSGFKVGAVIETSSGEYIGGCNIENATFGLTVCAERGALFKAISERKRSFRRICIIADTEKPTPPCGACRQLLWEFAGDIEIFLSNLQGIQRSVKLAELFPEPFDDGFFRESKDA